MKRFAGKDLNMEKWEQINGGISQKMREWQKLTHVKQIA